MLGDATLMMEPMQGLNEEGRPTDIDPSTILRVRIAPVGRKINNVQLVHTVHHTHHAIADSKATGRRRIHPSATMVLAKS